MNSNRGFFGGRDGALRYVCMDASFYRLNLLVKPSGLTFTGAAGATPVVVHAIANGQFFGTSKLDYLTNGCYSGPCRILWRGQIILSGTLNSGDPATAPNFRHIGQWNGCSQVSLAFAKGDPSAIAPPGYTSAFGYLMPLVQSRVAAPASALGSYWSNPDTVGKVVYGLARSAQIVFVLAQQDKEAGLTVPDLIARLVAMKVDDAVMGDGSDSATLVVDHTVEVTPGPTKNNSIPVGPMFLVHSFQLTGTRSMTKTPATTDPQLKMAISVADTVGNLSLTNTGMVLSVTSLGSPTGITLAKLISRLGVTLPLNLKATTSLITSAATLAAPNVSATLTLIPTATSDGRLTGTLTFTTSGGIAQFNIDWEVGDAP